MIHNWQTPICIQKKKKNKYIYLDPQQVVSGGFWVFKSFQKPPVGGYWYMYIISDLCFLHRNLETSVQNLATPSKNLFKTMSVLLHIYIYILHTFFW